MRALLVTLVVGSLVGCVGGGEPYDAPEGLGAEGRLVEETLATDFIVTSPYPSGPYGYEVGDVMANTTFFGPRGPVDLASLRDSGSRLLVLKSYANWCYWSDNSAAVEKLWDERYRDRGLRILDTIFEDENREPADAATAERVFGPDGFDVPYPYAADPYFDLGRYFDTAAAPMFLFIDLQTMRIRAIELGWGEDHYTEIIEGALAE